MAKQASEITKPFERTAAEYVARGEAHAQLARECMAAGDWGKALAHYDRACKCFAKGQDPHRAARASLAYTAAETAIFSFIDR